MSLKRLDVQRLGSVNYAETVTPSDADDIRRTDRLLISGAGDVSVIFAGDDDDNSITLTLTAGEWHKMAVKRILSTGTTATGIIAGYVNV